MSQHERGRRSREAERHKKAASDALTLLDWCIDYFAENRQSRIASQLARNRDSIRARLKD